MQFVDVFPNTPDRKVNLFPAEYEATAPLGLYHFQLDPATEQFPLTLISPASERTISSTLGGAAAARRQAADAPRRCGARGLEDGDPVRVFNELGEVHCTVNVTPRSAPEP